MPYVQRDYANKVIGRFANLQPGYAEEWLDDNAPDLQPTPQDIAISNITALESLQRQKLTDRAEREFKLAVFVLTGQTSSPAFIALKAIDDQIKALRAQL